MSRPAVNTARDARIVTAARAGASVPDLARRFRLSAERIRQVLAAAGVPRRQDRKSVV